MWNGRGGSIAMALCAALAACAVAAAVPAGAEAKRCRPGTFNRGGTCTSFATAAGKVVSITRSVMAAEDAKAVILRVNVGKRKLVNRGLGLSVAGVRASPKMKFRPGSMAIPLVTTLALQLQDKHRLDLDDKLSRWYPSYPNADRVTLRMLASVTSGYPDYIQENPPFQATLLADVFRQWNDDELLGYAFAQPPACDPGACFHYAHTNFILLGRVLEKVTGQSMTSLIRKRFLRPLRLRDTRISKLPDIPPPVLHAYSGERGVYEDSSFWSPSWGIGRGTVMTSNARDMIREIRAIGTGRLFSRSAMRQLVAPLSKGLPGAPRTIDYGLGIAVRSGWMFQNPSFNGYVGILAYLRSRGISLLIENTDGRRVVEGTSISATIFSALTRYLTPDHPISG